MKRPQRGTIPSHYLCLRNRKQENAMRTLLLLPLFAILVVSPHHTQTPLDGSQIRVLSFKWSKGLQPTDPSGPDKPMTARATTQADKNFDRNSRINDPAGVRDPNADTADTRSAALEKSVRDADKSQAKPV